MMMKRKSASGSSSKGRKTPTLEERPPIDYFDSVEVVVDRNSENTALEVSKLREAFGSMTDAVKEAMNSSFNNGEALDELCKLRKDMEKMKGVQESMIVELQNLNAIQNETKEQSEKIGKEMIRHLKYQNLTNALKEVREMSIVDSNKEHDDFWLKKRMRNLLYEIIYSFRKGKGYTFTELPGFDDIEDLLYEIRGLVGVKPGLIEKDGTYTVFLP